LFEQEFNNNVTECKKHYLNEAIESVRQFEAYVKISIQKLHDSL